MQIKLWSKKFEDGGEGKCVTFAILQLTLREWLDGILSEFPHLLNSIAIMHFQLDGMNNLGDHLRSFVRMGVGCFFFDFYLSSRWLKFFRENRRYH